MSGTNDLSFAEELLWRQGTGDPAAPPFFDCPVSLSIVVRLGNRPGRAALDDALGDAIRRHEVLRSAFPAVGGRPARILLRWIARPAAIDLTAIPAALRQALVERLLARHAARPFDLGRGPLVRAAVVTLAGNDHVLALTVHHIVFDSWSKRVLARELRESYRAGVAGRPSRLEPVTMTYRHYVRWQRRRLAAARGRALVEFWRAKLGGLPEVTLPADRPRSASTSTRSATCWLAIRPQDAHRLRVLSRERRVTVATAMLAILYVFLNRVTGMDDIAVGVPVSDRRRHELEGLVGLFANVVVVRASIDTRATFAGIVDRAHAALGEAYAHQDAPYGHLVCAVGGAAPLYRVVYNFVPAVPESAVTLPGLRVEHVPLAAPARSVADATLQVQSRAGGLAARFVYKADLFSAPGMDRFARLFEGLTTALLDAPREPIGTRMTDPCCA